MVDGLQLDSGERVVFRSTRGGAAGYSGWMWLLILFGGSQVCGSLMIIPIVLSPGSGDGSMQMVIMSAITLLLGGVVLARWILMRTRPSYFITDRRIIARRLFLGPVSVELDNVASANRVLVQYTRYGTVVNELLTNRVAVSLHRGGFRRFGPIKDADDFASLLTGVAQGVIDCRALPGADGELAAAETRTDLFFTQTTLTAGAPRGPLFVGPTKVIGFAEPFFTSRMNQVLTIAGAPRSAEEVEEAMLTLTQNSEFGRGRAVVMDREGLSLVMDKTQLKLASGEHMVAFDLTQQDAERAAQFVKRTQIRGYR